MGLHLFGLRFLQQSCHATKFIARPSKNVPGKLIYSRLSSSKLPSRITGSLAQACSSGKEIKVGDIGQLWHYFDAQSVQSFAALSGDTNPVHINPQYPITVSGRKLKGNIVHGIFTSSLFSKIFGQLFPGCIYASQDLKFEKPVFVNSWVVATIKVLRKRQFKNGDCLLICQTTCSTFEDDGHNRRSSFSSAEFTPAPDGRRHGAQEKSRAKKEEEDNKWWKTSSLAGKRVVELAAMNHQHSSGNHEKGLVLAISGKASVLVPSS